MHGDPTSDNREDPYFRQTSPVKTYQTRTPRKSAGGGQSSYAGHSSYAGSPGGRSMAHSQSHVQITTTYVDGPEASYGGRGGRDSPLRRNSPQRGASPSHSARGSPAQRPASSLLQDYRRNVDFNTYDDQQQQTMNNMSARLAAPMQSESPMRREGGENSFARESQYRASGGGGRDSSFARNHAYGEFGPSYLSG